MNIAFVVWGLTWTVCKLFTKWFDSKGKHTLNLQQWWQKEKQVRCKFNTFMSIRDTVDFTIMTMLILCPIACSESSFFLLFFSSFISFVLTFIFIIIMNYWTNKRIDHTAVFSFFCVRFTFSYFSYFYIVFSFY